MDGDQVVQAWSSEELFIDAEGGRWLCIGEDQVEPANIGGVDSGVLCDGFDDVGLFADSNDGDQVLLAVEF